MSGLCIALLSCVAVTGVTTADTDMQATLKGIRKVRVEVVFDPVILQPEQAGDPSRQAILNQVTGHLRTGKLEVVDANEDAIVRVTVVVTAADPNEAGRHGLRFTLAVRQSVALNRDANIKAMIDTWYLTRAAFRFRPLLMATVTAALDGQMLKELVADWRAANPLVQ